MNTHFNLSGSIVAIVTPFTTSGQIDYAALGKLLDFQINNGTNGIVVSGCTGESYSLSLEEFKRLITFTVEKSNKRVPIIAGTGASTTEEAMKKSQLAQRLGADALMVISPFLNKPTDKGLYNYYSAIADSVELPIIMYNVPGRTGKNLCAALTLRIANDHDNIIGIKEASGDLAQIMDIINNRTEGFKVYSGDDFLALAVISLGGDGCISVVANQIPGPFRRLIDAALSGEYEIAKHLQYKYLNLMNLNFVETNPIPVKASLAMMGMIQHNYRSPLCPLENEENYNNIKSELEALGLVKDSVLV